MTDYTKTTNFTAKDSLASGDSAKLIKGSEHDTEYDAIAVASATKYDSGNLASQAQAEAATLNTVLMTPLRTENWADTWAAENGGMIANIQALADPGADTFLGWDNSATDIIAFTLDASLATTTTALGLAAGVAGNGLTLTTGVLDITDVVAGAAQPYVITSGTVTFDLSSITEITGSNLSQSADGFVMSDAGVIKVMPIDQAGFTVATADAIQTFAFADANTVQVLSGTTTRVWTIPANSAVAFEIGTGIILQNSGTQSITVTADTGVILDSVFHTAAATAQSDTVVAGGMAVLIKTAADTWALSGDITT